jgi:YidC/Oxa1 family membrane protein insertase
MERRVFVAILLSFAVLFTYQTYFAPPPPKPGAAAQAAGEPGVTAKPSTSPAAGSSTVAPAPPVQAAETVVADTQERTLRVETTTIEAEFSNRGARLLHWRLKDYRDPEGNPVDLVPSGMSASQPTPFTVRVPDVALNPRLASALYRVSGDGSERIDASRAETVLSFDFEDASGLKVHREFRFQPTGFAVDFLASVSQQGKTLTPTIAWGPGLGDRGAAAGGGSFFTANAVQAPEAIFMRTGGKDERVAQANVAANGPYQGEFRFAGIDDHYFVAVAVNPGQTRIDYQPITASPLGTTQERKLVSMSITPADASKPLRFFVGPKQFDLLQATDTELVRVINFGMFALIVVPLLNTLKWLYGFTGNYGWSIILLTVIINLVMFPLRHKSAVAMRKMQALQPRMKAIQDRYAHLKMTDPERGKMQSEVSALYKEQGVNPASGCVPMLLTMPVLFAFYALLSQAIELRGAPFALWIHDLSGADPYYVIPALMGVTMFWQQRVTPAAMDPAQQKVMMIMPVMFTAMMVFSPSGVVLYWFVSNLWAIGQQYFTNWMIGPPPVPAPAATRRVKNVGSGRTTGAQRGE